MGFMEMHYLKHQVGLYGSGTSWNSDYNGFVALDYPFFQRGGNYFNEQSAGLFCFYYINGGELYYVSFRTVLWGSL